jgi:hypothetical protein
MAKKINRYVFCVYTGYIIALISVSIESTYPIKAIYKLQLAVF